jgi:hypothetical protein
MGCGFRIARVGHTGGAHSKEMSQGEVDPKPAAASNIWRIAPRARDFAGGLPAMMRSVFSVLVGFIAIVASHVGMDLLMHQAGIFPPLGQPMFEPVLNAIALGYRVVFSVLGCALTALLAPSRPMMHALTLGTIGTVLSSLGAFAAMNLNLGPMWYPIALALSALPSAWLGGMMGKGMRR